MWLERIETDWLDILSKGIPCDCKNQYLKFLSIVSKTECNYSTHLSVSTFGASVMTCETSLWQCPDTIAL